MLSFTGARSHPQEPPWRRTDVGSPPHHPLITDEGVINVRKIRIGTFLASLALAGVACLASPGAASAASGGGCSGYVGVGSGLSVNSCISYNGLTWQAIGDSYISGSIPGGCTFWMGMYDSYGTLVDQQGGNCQYHNWNTVANTWSGNFQNITRVFINGVQQGNPVPSKWQSV